MRAGLGPVCIGAAVASLLVMACSGAARAALDNEQFCKAMAEIARLGKSEVGRWLDRNTRDDGMEVLCAIRTVNFKRFVKTGPSAQDVVAWRARKQQEWNNTACNSAVLRDGIDGGWIITSTITTGSGQRLLVIATCK